MPLSARSRMTDWGKEANLIATSRYWWMVSRSLAATIRRAHPVTAPASQVPP